MAPGITWDEDRTLFPPSQRLAAVAREADNEMKDPEVVAKAESGLTFCEQATDHANTIGGKSWTYLLVPDSSIAPNMTIIGLAKKHTFQRPVQ